MTSQPDFNSDRPIAYRYGVPLWSFNTPQNQRKWEVQDVRDFKPDLETRLKQALAPGEKLLWFGRPDGRLQCQSKDIVRAVLSIPLLVIGWYVVREALATREVRREGIGEVGETTLWMLIAGAATLTLLGVYRITFLGPRLDARSRRSLIYGVTDRRVIISGSSRFPPRSFAIEPIDSISIEPGPSGTGSVVIQCSADGWYDPLTFGGCKFPVVLRWIDGPQEVRDLIANTQAAKLTTNQQRPWSWTAFQMELVLHAGESLLWSGSRLDRYSTSIDQTTYGVTDQRVIRIAHLDSDSPISSTPLENIAKVVAISRPDRDFGTVTISHVETPYPDLGESERKSADLQFIAVSNSRDVAAIVNEARRAQFHKNRLSQTGARREMQKQFPKEEFIWVTQHRFVTFDPSLMMTIYGISDQRAVVVEKGFEAVKVKSLPLPSIRELDFALHADGYGSVGCTSDANEWLTQFLGSPKNRGRLFYPVKNPEFVYQLLIDTLTSLGKTFERVGGNVVRVIDPPNY